MYSNEDNLVPSEVHWYFITNSFAVVIFLSLLVVSILIRNLKRDIAGYNAFAALADEELDEDDDEPPMWNFFSSCQVYAWTKKKNYWRNQYLSVEDVAHLSDHTWQNQVYISISRLYLSLFGGRPRPLHKYLPFLLIDTTFGRFPWVAAIEGPIPTVLSRNIRI